MSVEKNIETRSIKEMKEDKPVHISHKKLKVAAATPANTIKKRVKAFQEKPLEVASTVHTRQTQI